jgi:hypothetical protein
MTFQLDTSGFVEDLNEGREPWVWEDLSPFCQGYTAAILEAANAPFHKLAPATLQRIMADCEAWQASPCATGGAFAGKSFWDGRQAPWHSKGARDGSRYWDTIADFPPLTVTPGDDGLIYLREAA